MNWQHEANSIMSLKLRSSLTTQHFPPILLTDVYRVWHLLLSVVCSRHSSYFIWPNINPQSFKAIFLFNGFKADKATCNTSQTIFTLQWHITRPTFFSSARVSLTVGTKHLFNIIQGRTHEQLCSIYKEMQEDSNI